MDMDKLNESSTSPNLPKIVSKSHRYGISIDDTKRSYKRFKSTNGYKTIGFFNPICATFKVT